MALGKVDSDKNHIPLENKNQSYEERKKKLNQQRAKDWTLVKKTTNFKEIANQGRVQMIQPWYLLNYFADYLQIEVMIFLWMDSQRK